MEVRGEGATLRRVSEGGEWWEKGVWGELREKDERETWRGKSVMVAFRGRGERGGLALMLEKRMADGKQTFIANWVKKIFFRSEMRLKTFLDGCN